MHIAKFIFVTAWLAIASACMTYVPARVTQHPLVPLKQEATLYLIARDQRIPILESLRVAGVEIADEVATSDYLLEVEVGDTRASAICGTVNNVRYDLHDHGRIIMTIKGRGLTGGCRNNIFDDMSQTLASYL